VNKFQAIIPFIHSLNSKQDLIKKYVNSIHSFICFQLLSVCFGFKTFFTIFFIYFIFFVIFSIRRKTEETIHKKRNEFK